MSASTDLDFLTRYEVWPYYPWCPVKRDGVMGCVWWCEPTVYFFNVFSPPETLDSVEKVAYETLAALCVAGWRVD